MTNIRSFFALVLGLALVGVYSGCDKKGDRKPADKIVLVSPNGLHKVVIQATDTGAGVWVQSGEDRPMVAIYEGFGTESAVLGAYGCDRKSLDAAVWATEERGGGLQLKDAGQGVHSFDAASLGGSR